MGMEKHRYTKHPTHTHTLWPCPVTGRGAALPTRGRAWCETRAACVRVSREILDYSPIRTWEAPSVPGSLIITTTPQVVLFCYGGSRVRDRSFPPYVWLSRQP
ncbi:hypothetical protein PoB_000601000 [Plakobranchus ocellatus]|uniref:Uncharacterized protein n=1 Tax=Plakobranchus ocellatus TaxID=259542 RepID=A0AAV3Y8R6_9GAST|nr:hypothetical protein PoB_000601000 [Plakobranchus ocellatus]